MSVTAVSAPSTGDLVIRIDGRFDFSMSQEFRRAYEGKASPSQKIIVDLSKVDSSALGLLLMMREKLGSDSKRIRLLNPNQAVRRIFAVAKFDALFAID